MGESSTERVPADVLAALRRAPVETFDFGAATQAPLVPAVEEAASPLERVGLLASGGMGDVYLGRDGVLRRPVAIKVLRGSVDSEGGRRFLTEAQVTAQLSHPQVAPVYRLFVDEDGALGYVMKLVQGEPLTLRLAAAADARRARRPLPDDLRRGALLEVFLAVCDALAYAHGRGVVHRDLKPEHVVIGEHGEVYVMDWGLARVQDAPEGPDVAHADRTRPGRVMGTPQYMAPEQAKGEIDQVGPATDQYALGLILYEIACGRPARPEQPSLMAMVSLAASGTLAPMSAPAGGESLPRELRAIVARATAAAPGDRYGSVDALADDLRRFRADQPVHAMPDGVVHRATRWLSRRRELTFGLLWLLAVGVLGVGMGVVLTGTSAWWAYDQLLEAREARWTGFLTEVAEQAGQLDRAMALVEGQLEGLDGAAEALLVRGIPQGPQAVKAPEVFRDPLRRPGDTAYSALYDRPMSTRWGASVAAPGTSLEALQDELRRLAPVRHAMRRAHLQSRMELEGLDEAAAEEAWRSVEGPIRWTLIGTERGAYLDLPGADWDATGFDPRVRPWYLNGRQADQPHWGEPYQEASTGALLLPCSTALRGPDGVLLGVAAMDVAFSYLIDRFLALDHPAVQETFLVDQDARVMVRSSAVDRGGRPKDLSASYPMPPFEHPELVPALGATSGVVVVDGGSTRLVHVPLTTSGWWYVVEVDAAYLE